MTHITTLQYRRTDSDLCEVQLGCEFTIKISLCHLFPFSLLSPTSHKSLLLKEQITKWGRGQNETLQSWSLGYFSLAENSNLIKLLIQCKPPWWLASVYCGILGSFLWPKIHILPLASPFFGKELHYSSFWTYLYHLILHSLTICTQIPFTSEALRLYITVTYKFAYMEYIF